MAGDVIYITACGRPPVGICDRERSLMVPRAAVPVRVRGADGPAAVPFRETSRADEGLLRGPGVLFPGCLAAYADLLAGKSFRGADAFRRKRSLPRELEKSWRNAAANGTGSRSDISPARLAYVGTAVSPPVSVSRGAYDVSHTEEIGRSVDIVLYLSAPPSCVVSNTDVMLALPFLTIFTVLFSSRFTIKIVYKIM